MNDSANAVRVGTERTITTTRGQPVPANGGVFQLVYERDGAMTGQPWYVVASAATTLYRQTLAFGAPSRRVA